MNGSIPNLLGGADMGPGPSLIQLGFSTYGSDSGHQMAFDSAAACPEGRVGHRLPVQVMIGL